MGIRLLNPEGNNNTSGVALEIRNAAQTGQLGNLNVMVSKSMERIIAFMINWRYGLDYVSGRDIQFMLSGDFNPAPLGSDWMRLMTEWYQAGLIPRSLWIEVSKQNDIIPNDYEDSTGIIEIEKDELIVPVREQFDTETALEEERAQAKLETAAAKEKSAGATRGQSPGGANTKPSRERTKTYNDGSGSPER